MTRRVRITFAVLMASLFFLACIVVLITILSKDIDARKGAESKQEGHDDEVTSQDYSILIRLTEMLVEAQRAWFAEKSSDVRAFIGDNDREGTVRSLASLAFANAVCLNMSLKCGNRSSLHNALSGLTRQYNTTALNFTINEKHRRYGEWGYEWQSPLWAMLIGHAAQLANISSPEIDEMLATEAGVLRGLQTPFWSGKVRHDGVRDTKAEENCWRASLFHVIGDLAESERWAAAGYIKKGDNEAYPDDYNMLDDGTVYNGNIAPDYSVAQSLCLREMLFRKPSAATLRNADLIYQNLCGKPYGSENMTIYQKGMTYAYYPEGIDWDSYLLEDKLLYDVMIDVLGIDERAGHFVEIRGKEARRRLVQNGGLMHVDDWEVPYGGMNQYAAWSIAEAALASQTPRTK